MTFSPPLFFRILCALIGGYWVGICGSFAMIPILFYLCAVNFTNAVYFGLMFSYLIAFVAFIWCFVVKQTWRVASDMSLAALLFLTIYWLFPVSPSL
jgi:hypothetical protein